MKCVDVRELGDKKISGGEHNSNDAQKRLWKQHQANEYLHVNDDNEAVCFGCFTKAACNATLVDICGDCAGKKGREALLAVVAPKYYGLCYFCNSYKFNMEQINARLCGKCHRRVADITKEYNKSGGQFGHDPFWKHMRKKHGKEWKKILTGEDVKKVRI